MVRLAPGEKKIKADTFFTEEIDLLAEYASKAHRLGLVIYENVTSIKSASDDGGDSAMQPLPVAIDQDGKRLLFHWK